MCHPTVGHSNCDSKGRSELEHVEQIANHSKHFCETVANQIIPLVVHSVIGEAGNRCLKVTAIENAYNKDIS